MSAALIVEDGHSPYVLAAVRSLAAAGLRVGTASAVRNPRVSRSRDVSAWHRVGLPEDDLDAFTADVAAVVRQGRYDLVFGADDIELLALSARREELGALLPHAPHDAVVRAVDKLTLTQAAERVGVAVPRTVPADAAALAAWTGPVVVKARLHWDPATDARASSSRHHEAAVRPSQDQAHALVDQLGSALLQEPIAGEQLALSLVVDATGRARAVSQQHTLRSSLARTSSRACTDAVDPELLAGAEALLADLGWTGLANLQYLRPPGGRPHLIDLNGRFYGSLALAVAAGADLPATWARLALGQPVPDQVLGRPGVRFQALHADVLRARTERRGGLLHDLRETVGYAAGATHATWSRRDPVPALAWAGHVAREGLRRRRS